MNVSLPTTGKIPTNLPRAPADLARVIQDRIADELSSTHPSAIQLLELVLLHASLESASDVHISYSKDSILIRFRKEGRLCTAHTWPKNTGSELFSRIKIVAGLRIDEHQVPQDGRFTTTLPSGEELHVRVSVLPAYHGENIVVRLLSSSGSLQTLQQLGMLEPHRLLVQNELRKMRGLILVTGPTGSGKTTTLYSLLHLLNTKEHSVITIEDPIEYSIDGVVQVQGGRHSGVAFAEGMRSILRQDPNVIGIGEIRDAETADLAIHAALTGHGVLSTLHSGSAAAALHRLLHMGIEPYLIASTVHIVINQRLLPALCHSCTVTRTCSFEEQKMLEGIFDGEMVGSEFSHSKGCDLCNGSGVVGRIGVFEVLSMTPALQGAVLRRASMSELVDLCLADSMLHIIDDAIEKAKDSSISFQELMHIAYE